jgi:hypothetical protein
MRTLSDHIVEGDSANHQLTISVLDEPGQGGACHLYQIEGLNTATNPSDSFVERHAAPAEHATVLFQNGPIKEFGVNGITQEALLAVVIDRLKCFQEGPYHCDDNQVALDSCRTALFHLQARTRARIARGVEGTHTK